MMATIDWTDETEGIVLLRGNDLQEGESGEDGSEKHCGR